MATVTPRRILSPREPGVPGARGSREVAQVGELFQQAGLVERLRASQQVAAWGVALGLLALSEMQLGVYGRCCDPARVTDAGFLLTVAATLPLAWRRRAPARVLLVMGCAAVTQLVLHSPVTDFTTLAIAVAFYGVMAESSRKLAIPLAALTPAGIAVALGFDRDVPPYQILNIPLLFAGAWALGELTRHRRRQLAERASLADRE